jgi:hypothetical protein
MTDDISPDIQRAADSHVRWILGVLDDYNHRGHIAITEAVADLTDEQKDSALRMFFLLQHGQVSAMREAIRDSITRQHFDGLGGNPTLN